MTQKTKKMFIHAGLLALASAAFALLLWLIGYVGRAHAATGLNPDDPVGALTALYTFIRTGAGTAAVGCGMVALVWALRNLPFDAWKKWSTTPLGGYVLAYGTALLTYVGTALGSGNPFTASMLLNALGAALLAAGGWEHLRDILTAVKKTPPPMAGAAIVLLLFSCSGCPGVTDSKPAADVIDCTKADEAKLEQLALQLGCTWVGGSISACDSFKADWGTVEAAAEAAGVEIGGCVLASIVQQYLAKPQAKPVDQTWLAHDALEHFRTVKAKGATFHTAQGDL